MMDIKFDLVSLILIVLIVLLLFSALLEGESDIHPFILHNQANIHRVRNENESAIYRHRDHPEGFPVLNGLSVRKGNGPTTAGTLIDIWEMGRKNTLKIATIKGKSVDLQLMSSLDSRIYNLGSRLSQSLDKKSVCCIALPNGVELLISIMAAAYFGVDFILIDPDTPAEFLEFALTSTNAAGLITTLGNVPRTTSMKLALEVGSDDWNSISEQSASAQQDLDALDSRGQCNILTLEPVVDGWAVSSFSQESIASATAAVLKSIPTDHRLSPEDVIYPSEHLSNGPEFALILAGIVQGSTIVLQHAKEDAQYADIINAAKPTIIYASSELVKYIVGKSKNIADGTLDRVVLQFYNRNLSRGRLPPGLQSLKGVLGSRCRLLYLSSSFQPKNRDILHRFATFLRSGYGIYVIQSLSTPGVLGPITQSHIQDYRASPTSIGAVHPTCEIKLVDEPVAGLRVADEPRPRGRVWVSGSTIADETSQTEQWVRTGILAEWLDDGTLGLIDIEESTPEPSS